MGQPAGVRIPLLSILVLVILFLFTVFLLCSGGIRCFLVLLRAGGSWATPLSSDPLKDDQETERREYALANMMLLDTRSFGTTAEEHIGLMASTDDRRRPGVHISWYPGPVRDSSLARA